jgi:tetratricopeptide (TPR) repeat protein
MRRMLLIVAGLLAIAPVDAQRAPRRPNLPGGADANDARAYLELGHRILEDNPSGAYNAYYWAVRLNPASAEALYSLRNAGLMRRTSQFQRYMEGSESVIFSRDMVANDSLFLRALQIDPFLHERHRKMMQYVYFRKAIGDGYNTGQIDAYLADLINRAPASTRARLAVGNGNFPLAIDLYGEAIRASRSPMYLHLERGAVYAMQGMNAFAIADYNTGLSELRRRDLQRDRVVIFYSSKALHEHAVGLLQLRSGGVEDAKAAFGRAMTEDLSFYPSHISLSEIALAAKDTATALSEMALAAELAPSEAHVQHSYGALLVRLGKHADAVEPLNKAIALEPFWADPVFLLADAQEKTGASTEAAASFEKFLTLSVQRDGRRAEATRRAAALGRSSP